MMPHSPDCPFLDDVRAECNCGASTFNHLLTQMKALREDLVALTESVEELQASVTSITNFSKEREE